MGHVHRLIAFDLDGTLIDSKRDLTASANDLIVELGGAPLSEEAVSGMVGDGARVLVMRALAAVHIEPPSWAVERFLAIYDTRLFEHTHVYEGIPEALRAANDVATVAVLTNKPLKPAERLIEGLGLRALVGTVIGGDGPFARKPDPAALIHLMRAAGCVPDHTLLVGDSAIDRETARRAGSRCCMTLYGFGAATLGPTPDVGVAWHVQAAGELSRVFAEFAADA